MQAVFIVFNQANTERVEYMLDQLNIRGFTFFEEVQGRGTKTGEPRKGTHTWPEMNSAVITIVEEDKVDDLLATVKKLDRRNKEVGVRAFVWDIVRSY
ncbi:MAG TPA: P-II family nitrogen regulator [Marinilabiliaceae bacterium]|nr:P-II family nitrogen regulator [Marinilabiliaceae bacterium]